MSTFVDLSGLDNLISRVKSLERMNVKPLMDHWMILIANDNRKGVLAGTDKDGNAMAPVKYRPKGEAVKTTAAQRNGAKANATKSGVFGGLGRHAAGLNNNLTPAEYRKLSGPPLAPRGAFSRVITNLQTDYAPSSDGTIWTAWGAWVDVVSAKGVKFLGAHFNGVNRLPKRDLRGVRPEGRALARKALIAWASGEIRFGRSNSSRAA